MRQSMQRDYAQRARLNLTPSASRQGMQPVRFLTRTDIASYRIHGAKSFAHAITNRENE